MVFKWVWTGICGMAAVGTVVISVGTGMGEHPWGEASAYPVHHDVAYYATHPVERHSVIVWCRADTAHAASSDCGNAMRGELLASIRK
jgi:hypothetical protein